MQRSLGKSLRRGLVVAVGTTIGLLSVGALASPASAHEADIRGEAVCESNGEYKITWTVTNDFPGTAVRGRVQVTPEGTSVDLPRNIPPGSSRNPSSITGVQRVPGDTRFAELELDRVTWPDDDYVQEDGLSGRVRLEGTCSPQQPPTTPPTTQPPNPPAECVSPEAASFSHTFNGAGGAATVSLAGPKPLCEGAQQDFSLISYTASKEPGAVQEKFDSATGVVDKNRRTVNLKVDLPPCFTKVYLIFGSKQINPITATGEQYGDTILGSVGKPGKLSKGPKGEFTGGTVECDGTPSATFANTCENVTITLINDGIKPAEFTGAAKVGDAAYQPFGKPVIVQPGKKESFVVPGQPDLSVKVTSGEFSKEHTWSAPEGCDSATPGPEESEVVDSPEPGAGGGLPVTGASVGGLIAAALAATGLGVALVIMARRRRRAA